MIGLGDTVKDTISGLIGIVVHRTEYLNGCVQFGVQPKYDKKKNEISNWSIDSEQLVLVKKKSAKIKKTKPPGGPTYKFINPARI